MKKILSFLFLPLVILTSTFLIWLFFSSPIHKPVSDNKVTENPEVLGTPDQNTNLQTLKLNDKEVRIIWYKIDNLQNLYLNTNLKDQESASVIYDKKNCKLLVNAGFYSPEMKHIGLFKSNNELISSYNKNSLFNGFLTLNYAYTPRITKELPQDSLVFALQTGPLLIQNTFPTKNLNNTKTARRMVAAVNGSNELIFLSFYNKDSAYQGPTLSELPELLKVVSSINNLNIADAINLDGGSASAFISKNQKLAEITTIGGYFCLKND